MINRLSLPNTYFAPDDRALGGSIASTSCLSSPPHVPPVSPALVHARTVQQYQPLIHQLRFLFGLDDKEGRNIPDEDVLYFGKVLYANEAFAKMVIEASRKSGSRRFILDSLVDFLYDNRESSGFLGKINVNCSVSDELPERLALINEILCFARNNRESNFAWGLAQNQNFIPTPSDITFARNNRDSYFAWGLAQNQNFIPTPDDITFARNNRDSDFAWGLAQNQNFIPDHDDIIFARNNRESLFAPKLARNQNFIPDHDDIAFVRNNRHSFFAGGLAQNQNFIPTPDDITFARNNRDSLFAGGLAQNQNFIPNHDDIAFVRNNRESLFAWGLAQNQNIFYPEFET